MIYRDPEVRGGHPCIVGTGIRVLDIVRLRRFGNRSPEQIAESFSLTLGQVYTALAYYHEHKAEIDEDISEDIRIGEELARPKALANRTIRFFLDANIEAAVAEQLSRRGIDVITAQKTHPPGEDDEVLLEYAKSVGRVMCTYDKHFIDIGQVRHPTRGNRVFCSQAFRNRLCNQKSCSNG